MKVQNNSSYITNSTNKVDSSNKCTNISKALNINLNQSPDVVAFKGLLWGKQPAYIFRNKFLEAKSINDISSVVKRNFPETKKVGESTITKAAKLKELLTSPTDKAGKYLQEKINTPDLLKGLLVMILGLEAADRFNYKAQSENFAKNRNNLKQEHSDVENNKLQAFLLANMPKQAFPSFLDLPKSMQEKVLEAHSADLSYKAFEALSVKEEDLENFKNLSPEAQTLSKSNFLFNNPQAINMVESLDSLSNKSPKTVIEEYNQCIINNKNLKSSTDKDFAIAKLAINLDIDSSSIESAFTKLDDDYKEIFIIGSKNYQIKDEKDSLKNLYKIIETNIQDKSKAVDVTIKTLAKIYQAKLLYVQKYGDKHKLPLNINDIIEGAQKDVEFIDSQDYRCNEQNLNYVQRCDIRLNCNMYDYKKWKQKKYFITPEKPESQEYMINWFKERSVANDEESQLKIFHNDTSFFSEDERFYNKYCQLNQKEFINALKYLPVETQEMVLFKMPVNLLANYKASPIELAKKIMPEEMNKKLAQNEKEIRLFLETIKEDIQNDGRSLVIRFESGEIMEFSHIYKIKNYRYDESKWPENIDIDTIIQKQRDGDVIKRISYSSNICDKGKEVCDDLNVELQRKGIKSNYIPIKAVYDRGSFEGYNPEKIVLKFFETQNKM